MPFKADVMLHLHSPYEFTFENKSSDNPQTGRQSQGEAETAELVDIKRALGKVLLMLLTRAYIMHLC